MSAQASAWVMERSHLRGLMKWVLVLIANDSDSEGIGRHSSITRLSRQAGLCQRAVTQILHRIEASGELLCRERGTGASITIWEIPGVVRDGFSLGSRGGRMPPQQERLVLGGGVNGVHPRGERRAPQGVNGVHPLSTPSTIQELTNSDVPPQSVSSGKYVEKVPEELMQALADAPYRMDSAGIARLWVECRLQEPGVTVEKILRLAAWKVRTAQRVKNLGGFLISVLPDICRHDALYPRQGSSAPPPQ